MPLTAAISPLLPLASPTSPALPIPLFRGGAGQPGRFVSVSLRPHVTTAAGGDADLAPALHEQTHHACFIANSLNVQVACTAEIRVAD